MELLAAAAASEAAPESATLLALIAKLTLDDVDDLQKRHKGKSRASLPPSDLEIALRLQEEEARSLLGLSKDYQIAQSLKCALDTDCALVQELERMENRARQDREAAVALSQGRPLPPRSSSPASPHEIVAKSVFKSPESAAENLSHSKLENRTSSSAGPSTSGRGLEKHECVICTDVIRGYVIRAPCGHYYDQGCLSDLFTSTINDESLYPPRCCQKPFILAKVSPYLGSDLCKRFEKKAAEFGTPDRVYCHRRECSAFLGAATPKASRLPCRECFSYTCSRCKAAGHPSAQPCDPSLNAEDERVLALARESGWTRCPGCRQLVELTHGCYHMTCRCREQFCYVCAAKWKTCACPQWEEDRLLSAAEDRVQRQRPQGQPAAPEFRRMVAREVDRLRQDHDCAHEDWYYRGGAGRCEHCGHFLDRYLLRCRGCQTLACVRCQRNRL